MFVLYNMLVSGKWLIPFPLFKLLFILFELIISALKLSFTLQIQ